MANYQLTRGFLGFMTKTSPVH
uniref:Uncharacterized protein n=1 Tax=Anguilla anguilla TaxID=7936 RepID=A0A0E9T7G8_ANGAN